MLSGAAVLVPARRYPRWVKQTLTWGSTLGIAALAARPGTAQTVLRQLRDVSGEGHLPPGDASVTSAPDVPATEDGGGSSHSVPDLPPASLGVRLFFVGTVGALMYGSWRFSFWLDEAAERGLRRLHVPYPRVVMGAALGVATWVDTRRMNRQLDQRQQAHGPAVVPDAEATTSTAPSSLGPSTGDPSTESVST